MATILGFDTATPRVAVAVARDGEPLVEEWVAPEPGGRPRHAQELLPAIERAAGQAGGWDAVDRIAVGVGPGAFTGLRVGVATAMGLARSRRLPLAGVGSLAALAAGMETIAAPRLPTIDARRGEVFAALYSPTGDVLMAPVVAPPDAVAAGDGSLRFSEPFQAVGIAVLDRGDPAHRLQALQVCRLGITATPAGPAGVEPVYLRRPDAELWRERDRGGVGGA